MIENYNSKSYAKWRNAIFKRDRYTCQKCGQVGGRLNVHHVRRKNAAKKYGKDGITLCVSCHKKPHRRK